ncbi:hypothetical protein [Saccharopolyspora erythraea]|nr:hypothetical protein [Saccharopolyspora erythraea]
MGSPYLPGGGHLFGRFTSAEQARRRLAVLGEVRLAWVDGVD